MKTYLRSELATLTGFSSDTIRYYEKQGLLKPEIGENNYRRYTEDDTVRLRFISLCKEFDFTLQEIQEMMEIVDSGQRSSLLEILKKRISETEEEIEYLQQKLPKLKDIYAKAQDGICWLKEAEKSQ